MCAELFFLPGKLFADGGEEFADGGKCLRIVSGNPIDGSGTRTPVSGRLIDGSGTFSLDEKCSLVGAQQLFSCYTVPFMQYEHPNLKDVTLASVLHALSDPVRLCFVQTLAEKGELPCCAVHVPVAKSTLSHHLNVLRTAGIIFTRVHGTQSLTSLRTDELNARFPGLLKAVLSAKS